MTIVYIIIALSIIILIVVPLLKKKTSPSNYPGGKIDWVSGADQWIDTELSRSDKTNDIFIAGLAHHCNVKDCGIFGGVIFNEKDNPVDKKAMAIGSNQSKKIIGYIPSAILDNYRKWCSRKDCHCVGYIYRQEGTLRGRVRVYHPECDNDIIEKDGAQYLEKVCEIFGWEIPSGDFKI